MSIEETKQDKAFKKMLKNMPTGFQEEADRMTVDQLQACISTSMHNTNTSIEEIESKQEYKNAVEALKLLKEPISAIKKAQGAVQAYCLLLLEQKGKL